MDKRKEFIDNAIKWAFANKARTDYSLLCLAFVEDAYERSNNIEMFGGSTAMESAKMYGYTNVDSPSKGDFVFYSTTGLIDGVVKNWGQVGLCTGDENVIHTWDIIRVDNFCGIQDLESAPGWSSPKYLGWTPPEVFLKGYKEKYYQ